MKELRLMLKGFSVGIDDDVVRRKLCKLRGHATLYPRKLAVFEGLSISRGCLRASRNAGQSWEYPKA